MKHCGVLPAEHTEGVQAVAARDLVTRFVRPIYELVVNATISDSRLAIYGH